jgi:hypothetical protein
LNYQLAKISRLPGYNWLLRQPLQKECFITELISCRFRQQFSNNKLLLAGHLHLTSTTLASLPVANLFTKIPW